MPSETSISDIAAGKHNDNDLVWVAGLANGFEFHDSRQGDPWVKFTLASPKTAVTVHLHPLEYNTFGPILGPTLDRCRPPQVRVAGLVIKQGFWPVIIATDVVRLTEMPGLPLEAMRASSIRARAAGGAS